MYYGEENGDSEHEIVDCSELKKGELHRFKNAAGVEYSAIYVHGEERYSIERDGEAGMIRYANEMLG